MSQAKQHDGALAAAGATARAEPATASCWDADSMLPGVMASRHRPDGHHPPPVRVFSRLASFSYIALS